MPELENGCRSTTPAGDNLILDFVRLEVEGFAAVARAAGGRVEVDEELGVNLADAAAPTPFGNLAHLSRPVPEPATPRLVETLRGFFDAVPGGPFLVFSPWPTADLGPHGFTLAGHPPLMVRPPGGPAEPAPGLDVVEVETPEQLADFERTLAEAYPAPELLPFGSRPWLLRDDLLRSRWRLCVGYEGDRPVATAAGYAGDRLVAVEIVSTRPECRGRGYGAAITAAAAASAPELPAVLVASDLGRGVYEGLGYLAVSRYTLWIGRRS